MAECKNQAVAGYRRSDGGEILVRCGAYHCGDKVLCDPCESKAQRAYPQGWRFHPGDTCRHGAYTGGSGADLMCQRCENGER